MDTQRCDKTDRTVEMLPAWMQSQFYQCQMGRHSWYEGLGRRSWCFAEGGYVSRVGAGLGRRSGKLSRQWRGRVSSAAENADRVPPAVGTGYRNSGAHT